MIYLNKGAIMSAREITRMDYIGSTKGFKSAQKKPIYTVTSLDERSQDYVYQEKIPKKLRRTIRPRCWGWLPTLKEAQQAVRGNAGDMAECCYYTHVVIEEFSPGIPGCMFSNLDFQMWYKWKVNPKDQNKFEGKWIKCPQPKWAKGICGYGMS
jgi:hypothetical protein